MYAHIAGRHKRHKHDKGSGGSGGPGGLQATATGAYTVSLSWPAVAGAGSVEVYMDGGLIDTFPANATDAYTVRQLWPQSSYSFLVNVRSQTGAVLNSFSASALTQAPSGAFPRLYAPSAFVNTLVGPTPSLDPNSTAIVSSALSPYSSSANLSDDNDWGIPIVAADPQSPTYDVGCQIYWCNLDFGAVPIPALAQPNTGGDGHLAVLEPDGSEMDMWLGQLSGSSWSAGTRWLTSAVGSGVNCTTAHSCGGADAANFALAAGIVRPEEIAQGHIDHALFIATPFTRQGYVACPATSGDGRHSSANALPIGAHVQLDPSVNVASLPIPAWQKVIATALQQYGAYVGDTGGSLEVRAESNVGRGFDAWAKAGVPSDAPSLSGIPWSRMRVLSMTQCA